MKDVGQWGFEHRHTPWIAELCIFRKWENFSCKEEMSISCRRSLNYIVKRLLRVGKYSLSKPIQNTDPKTFRLVSIRSTLKTRLHVSMKILLIVIMFTCWIFTSVSFQWIPWRKIILCQTIAIHSYRPKEGMVYFGATTEK